MNLEIPFIGNTNDDNHCVQASLGMILKYFEPEGNYSWDELNDITAANHEYWTWPFAMLLWLTNNGYEVKVQELFDYEEFINKGAQYIYDTAGEEVGRAQEANSHISKEQERAKELLGLIDKLDTLPTQDDVIALLQQGYVPLCRVNSSALNGREGYYGHSIIVKGYDKDGLIIHDPGLPPLENRYVKSEDFERAWGYPTYQAKNVVAIKRKYTV